MAVTILPLIEPVQVAAADTIYYTAQVPTRIDKMTVTNPTATPRWITVNWVPSAGASSASNTMVFQRFVNAGESWDIAPMIGHTLAVGDTIHATASAATALVLSASGTQVTS